MICYETKLKPLLDEEKGKDCSERELTGDDEGGSGDGESGDSISIEVVIDSREEPESC